LRGEGWERVKNIYAILRPSIFAKKILYEYFNFFVIRATAKDTTSAPISNMNDMKALLRTAGFKSKTPPRASIMVPDTSFMSLP
jgi:hypothetical protein